jgi:hypothetical protein
MLFCPGIPPGSPHWLPNVGSCKSESALKILAGTLSFLLQYPGCKSGGFSNPRKRVTQLIRIFNAAAIHFHSPPNNNEDSIYVALKVHYI